MVIDRYLQFWKGTLLSVLTLCFVFTILEGCAANKVGTGIFPNTDAIDDHLIRGQSTRSDVQKILGIPSGAGGAMLPGVDENSQVIEPYDVWYYEDIETKNPRSEGGFMVMDLRQQILIIFFKGDRYHGYFWTSN